MKSLLVALLTLNVAGIPIVHPHWSQRREALGERLRAGGYDVVALQEVWFDGDAAELAKLSGLPHFARFERRVSMGTGLAILSRWPIVEKRQRTFTCRPSKLRSANGEPLVSKGALMVRLKTPAGLLDVYDTHLISQYANARYRTLRLTQAFDVADFIAQTSTATPFALAGDLNETPGDPAYELIADLLGLEDPCRAAGRETCGPSDDDGRRRIDHVLLPRGSKASTAIVEFAPLPNGKPLSDHKGVAAKIKIVARLAPDPRRRLEALARFDAALSRLTEAILERLGRRSWIPLYGFLLTARYEHQLEQLYTLRQRVETARIRTRALIR